MTGGPKRAKPLLLRVGTCYDGCGGVIQDAELRIEDGRITAIGRWRRDQDQGGATPPGDVDVETYPDWTAIPGLIDTHVHVGFGDARTYEEVMEQDSDGLMMMRALRNMQAHLRSGVTTLRDLGERGRVAFDLRQAQRLGYLPPLPRLSVVGRPITVTRGHFWFCGEEADGPEAVRRSVRRLAAEGADVIKMMVTGGGTVGSYPRRASFSVEELRAAVDEAHRFGLRVIVHAHATEGIANAVAAGVDGIEHCSFLEPDGRVRFDEELAKRIADAGIRVCPTPQVLQTRVLQLQALQEQRPLTEREQAILQDMSYRVDQAIETSGRLHRLGVKLVGGSDAIWTFGEYWLTYEALRQMGLTARQALTAVTYDAACDLGIAGETGSLRPGMAADLVLLGADPEQAPDALRRVERVMLAGAWVA